MMKELKYHNVRYGRSEKLFSKGNMNAQIGSEHLNVDDGIRVFFSFKKVKIKQKKSKFVYTYAKSTIAWRNRVVERRIERYKRSGGI